MRALACLLLGLFGPAAALAAPDPALPTPDTDEEPERPLIPAAENKLAGHILAGASAGLLLPWGDLDQSSSAANLGSALGFGLDAGFGITRSLVVGAWGQYATHAESSDCGGCTATGFAVGPFIRYHLVQGVRFDPWLTAGVGYRVLKLDSAAGSADYSGIEWLRVAVGGDYYPLSGFGFGPMLEFTSGMYHNRPDESDANGVHFGLLAGLRVAIDAPGR